MAIVASTPAATWESFMARNCARRPRRGGAKSAAQEVRSANAIALLSACTAIVGQIDPVRSYSQASARPKIESCSTTPHDPGPV